MEHSLYTDSKLIATGVNMQRIIRERRAQNLLVLIACDKEEVLNHTAMLLLRLRQVKHVVKIKHSNTDRVISGSNSGSSCGSCLDAAAHDVAFLLAADEFVGTALSSFSFLIHAMGLMTPYYMGHVQEGHVQERHQEGHVQERHPHPSHHTLHLQQDAFNDVGGRGRAEPTRGAPERWRNEGGGGRCTRGRGTESGLVSQSVGAMYYWRQHSHHCLKGERGAEECGMLQDDLVWETRMRNCTAIYEILRHKCAEERHSDFFLFMSVELTLSKITELTFHKLCRRPSGVSRRNKSRRGLSHS